MLAEHGSQGRDEVLRAGGFSEVGVGASTQGGRDQRGFIVHREHHQPESGEAGRKEAQQVQAGALAQSQVDDGQIGLQCFDE